MVLTCTRCSRVNPEEALFCYHDGVALGDPSRRPVTDPARRRFPTPFIFPSGQACHSFDELALAIQGDWIAARSMLEHGVFAGYFAGLGRADLARVAREAARESDLDRGVDDLLRALPASVLEPPRILADPGQVNLGTLHPGQDVRFDLVLSNSGMGLLTGTITCEEGPWLAIDTAGARSRRKVVQFLHEATLSIQVRGKALAASSKPLLAHLAIETNGGQVQVPVTVEVPVTPFPEGVLAGAVTPRQVAQLARERPHEAAELFAHGAVARWYESNGWTYPVKEQSASGIAGVQQFFEALGLTTPPRVNISDSELALRGKIGESLRASLQISTQEKKPVLAHARTDQPWIEVDQVALEGRSATIHLRVPEVPDRPGEILHAWVEIKSNGRQRFHVPVTLAVRGSASSVRPAPQEVVHPLEPPPIRRRVAAEPEIAEALPHEAPAVSEAISGVGLGRYVLAGLPVLFLIMGLLVVLVRDLSAWSRQPAAGGPLVPQADLTGLPQDICIHFHDRDEHVQLSPTGGVKPAGGVFAQDTRPALWEASMRFGLDFCGTRGRTPGRRLTFDPVGRTNNTVIRLDGAEWLFGDRPFRGPAGQSLGSWPGRWLERNAAPEIPMRDGRRSVWIYDRELVVVTQTVGLVPGAQSGRIDTCLVHYRIENRDRHPHEVGLRFLLDTYIGANDGVPYLIPGARELCVTRQEFNGVAEVPDFIRARETQDMTRPGTIALVQLKVPGFEPPSRVTLGAWPNSNLGPDCLEEKTLWRVPVLPIRSMPEADSAVAIYWEPFPLPPGRRREVAFAYGLGQVSAGEAGGALGLSTVGSFVPNGEFTLTAEVRNPSPGQSLTLTLPPGFTLISGRPTEAVPAVAPEAASRISPVTWRVRAGGREGTYSLRVQSSTGVAQTAPVRIKVRGIFGG